jgi:hypothetical protein
MAKKTHHKHSSSKGYRKLLDSLAELDNDQHRGCDHRRVRGDRSPRRGGDGHGRARLDSPLSQHAPRL